MSMLSVSNSQFSLEKDTLRNLDARYQPTLLCANMKHIVILLVHLLTTVAKLLGPGGAKAIIAENLLLKQQLLVVTRSERRAPNLSTADRFIMGFWSLFLRPARIVKNAFSVRPSTLLNFHECLVRRKYRRLFSSKKRTKPGPKGPSDALIRAIVELKRRRLSAYRADHIQEVWYPDRQASRSTRPLHATTIDQNRVAVALPGSLSLAT
jgi:hypothetical protein